MVSADWRILETAIALLFKNVRVNYSLPKISRSWSQARKSVCDADWCCIAQHMLIKHNSLRARVCQDALVCMTAQRVC